MAEPSTADVVVVGAGVMGSAAAWWLARQGADVAVFDRFEAGHTRGSSHGGSRIFRLAYAEPQYVDLAREALDLWRELELDAGETLVELTGGVDHGDAAAVDAIAAALAAAGRAVERLSPDEATARWPGIRFEGHVLHSPDTGRIRADATVRALQRCAAAAGARLHFGEGVVALDAGRRTVRTDQGREVVARRAVVVAAGAWVTKLLAGTGFALPPLQVTQEHVLHFPPAPGDPTTWPSLIHYRADAIASYALRTPGEGVKVGEHHTGPVVDPDERTFAVDPAGRARVVAYVRDWLPGLSPTPVSETTCLYTSTPDQSFVIDRSGDVVVGSACSGHGFKFAPLVGRRLAHLALLGDPPG